MACTSCTDTTPCGTPDCGCKFEVDAGCVRYSGESLGAAGIVEGDTLATILETLNTKFETYGPGDYVDVVDEAAGSNCAFGGLKFILYSGLDNTVKETKYICGIGAASFLNGTGTANRIPKFLDADTLGDSIMSESGTVITVGGTLKITGGTPGLGKVLTSDADGDASWTTPSSGGDLMKDGSVALTANWDAGSYTITSNKIVSVIDATVNGLTVGKGGGNLVENTAVGINNLSVNTTGIANTAIGSNSLAGNTTGMGNVAVGDDCLRANTTGSGNVAIGHAAAPVNSTGVSNVAIGDFALFRNTIGGNNTAIGDNALASNTSGTGNIAIGQESLFRVQSTDNNIGLGYRAGRFDETGTAPNYDSIACMYIGHETKSFGSGGGNENEIVIGNATTGNGTNTTTIGNTSTLNTYLHGNFNLKNTTAPTTATVTQTKYLPITINGTAYKLLLAD
jgi:hypothetical protein